MSSHRYSIDAERMPIDQAGSVQRQTGVKGAEQREEKMAESQGFEPWVPVKVQRFSRPSRSTAPATLHTHLSNNERHENHKKVDQESGQNTA